MKSKSSYKHPKKPQTGFDIRMHLKVCFWRFHLLLVLAESFCSVASGAASEDLSAACTTATSTELLELPRTLNRSMRDTTLGCKILGDLVFDDNYILFYHEFWILCCFYHKLRIKELWTDFNFDFWICCDLDLARSFRALMNLRPKRTSRSQSWLPARWQLPNAMRCSDRLKFWGKWWKSMVTISVR